MSCKTHFSTQKIFAALALMALLAPCAPAHADDDMLDLDTSHWMSFDHYKEKAKHGQDFDPSAAENADKAVALPRIDAPSADAAADASAPAQPAPENTANAAAKDAKPGDPQIAAPARPLNPPVMPGMNKAYDISVTSTEDDRRPVAQITNIESQPDVKLPENNWLKAADAVKQTSKPAQDADGEDAEQPLNVRFASLPNRKVSPVPSPEYKSNHGRALELATPPKEEPKNDDHEARAALAAMNALKKQQLEAIESDRETLTALQNAISQMGLQKQLSFMAGAKGAVNQAENGPDIKMDMPLSPVLPAKN